MRTKNLRYALACMLCLAASTAQAASISATASPDGAGIGDIITVSLQGDFSSLATIGGGFDVFFDSSHLSFLSFGFSDSMAFADDLLLRREPDELAGELNGIGFGHFDGLGGVFDIASIQFQVLSAGSSLISLAVNEGGLPSNPGGFFDIDGFEMKVDFIGTEVTTIPLPATFWLLGAAGSMLLGWSRRQS